VIQRSYLGVLSEFHFQGCHNQMILAVIHARLDIEVFDRLKCVPKTYVHIRPAFEFIRGVSAHLVDALFKRT